MNNRIPKSYRELIEQPDFVARFNYLKLNGICGEEDPDVKRWLHQYFYHTPEWRSVRSKIVLRDNGLDLGCEGRVIYGKILVHHINPITIDDIRDRSPKLFDPDNLITTSHLTHNAIHYGDEESVVKDYIERSPGDTKLW